MPLAERDERRRLLARLLRERTPRPERAARRRVNRARHFPHHTRLRRRSGLAWSWRIEVPTPITLLVDDGCPLVHVYRHHWEDVHHKRPETRDGRPLEDLIPNAFLDRFCDVVERRGNAWSQKQTRETLTPYLERA